MLVLSRKVGETVCIGDNVFVTVTGVKGNRVRLAIGAPPETHVLRSELAFDASENYERCRLSQHGGLRTLQPFNAGPAKG